MKFISSVRLWAILIAFCFISATNMLNAKEWASGKDEKSGGFVGVNYDPLFTIGVFGGYQWYLYDKPHFHLGVRLVGNFDISFENKLYNAVNFDVSPHLIWDFLNVDEHTLGWHFAPFGFGMQFYIAEGGILKTGGSSGGSGFSIGDANLGYLFQTGLHYYHNLHHQVYVTYRSGNTYKHTFKLGYAYKF